MTLRLSPPAETVPMTSSVQIRLGDLRRTRGERITARGLGRRRKGGLIH
jgi:hypothetical protein